MPATPESRSQDLSAKDGPVKSFSARLDPEDSLGQAKELARLLRNPLVRTLLRLTPKAPKDLSAEVEGIVGEMQGLIDSVPRAARLLGPLGWSLHGTAMSKEYAAAAQLVADGNPDAADQLLTDAWNDGQRLRIIGNRIKTLYATEDERGFHRWRALDQALRCHDLGLYMASINVTLALIEGVVNDFSEDVPRRRFYRRGAADLLTDEATVAGHPESLPVLSRLLGAQQETTEATGRLSRNGVVHGRELSYDTRINSTKALVAFMTVVEWAQPIARQIIDARAAELVALYTGSEELDDSGRRRDRRGFVGAKILLTRLQSWQFGFHKRTGSYARTLEELDPGNSLKPEGEFSLNADVGADEYWAWQRTRAGWIFGVAGAHGSIVGWQYSGPTPPAGGPGVTTGWAHVVDDPSHPDW